MWLVLKRYLGNVPNALRERELPSGEKPIERVYTPHSLRATAATLLLDSGVDIIEVPRTRCRYEMSLASWCENEPSPCIFLQEATE